MSKNLLLLPISFLEQSLSQTSSWGFLASQITTSQWTKTWGGEKTDLGLSSLGIPALKSQLPILPDDSGRCRLSQKQTSGPQNA